MGRPKNPRKWTTCPRCGQENALRSIYQIRQQCHKCGIAYPNPRYQMPGKEPDKPPSADPPAPPTHTDKAPDPPPTDEPDRSLLDDLMDWLKGGDAANG